MSRIARTTSVLVVCSLAAILLGCRDEPLPPLPPDTTSTGTPDDTSAATNPADVRGPAIAPIIIAPHQGRMIAIDDGKGYVECVVDSDHTSMRLYFLDRKGRPLKGVKDISVFVTTSQGPRRLPTRECQDADYARACASAALDSGSDSPGAHTIRKDAPAGQAGGLVRFRLHDERQRVLLPQDYATTVPVDSENETVPADDQTRRPLIGAP